MTSPGRIVDDNKVYELAMSLEKQVNDVMTTLENMGCFTYEIAEQEQVKQIAIANKIDYTKGTLHVMQSFDTLLKEANEKIAKLQSDANLLAQGSTKRPEMALLPPPAPHEWYHD